MGELKVLIVINALNLGLTLKILRSGMSILFTKDSSMIADKDDYPHLRDVMVVVDVIAQETFLLEVRDPWLHHLVEDVVAPLDLLQLDDLILQGHLGVLLLAVPRADHGEVGDDLLGVLRLSCTRLAAKKVPSETSGREVKKRNESLKDQTRPGVDKVKPKVWFKYSL